MAKRKPAPKGPVCWGCGNKPARKLISLSAYDRPAIFCSVECAARSALQEAWDTGLEWCDTHQDWYACGQPCNGCASDARAHEEAVAPEAVDAQAAERRCANE